QGQVGRGERRKEEERRDGRTDGRKEGRRSSAGKLTFIEVTLKTGPLAGWERWAVQAPGLQRSAELPAGWGAALLSTPTTPIFLSPQSCLHGTVVPPPNNPSCLIKRLPAPYFLSETEW
uniref:Uncharacterized protein n=1 Tax=Mustela putorius furo TaxID=9669 RepID=M3YYI4_MUSPF